METKTKQEAVDDVDEVAITMTKGDWRLVLEFFESMPYEDDWADNGTLADEQQEHIRQKLIIASAATHHTMHRR